MSVRTASDPEVCFFEDLRKAGDGKNSCRSGSLATPYILGQVMLDFGCLGHIMLDFSTRPKNAALKIRDL
jgi:hypothetical protein